MSPSKQARPSRRPRKTHVPGRHAAAPAGATRRREPKERTHVAILAALEALGWRVTELRPEIAAEMAPLWRVAITRVDLVANMSVIAPDPDMALEELARYAAVDAEEVGPK